MYWYKSKLLAVFCMKNDGERKPAYTVCSVLEGLEDPSVLDKTFVHFIR